ncbi:hypothetical protein [Solicola sp. PLA-1-18]|uniref:hypothetical protein n=1 Tax=Solicola sp. PLA-1-18 TaxID=3380532 RepID=UPI003B802872
MPAGGPATDPRRTTPPPMSSIDRVRRRVGAVGLFSITIHGVLGLIGGAYVVMGQGRRTDASWLLVISALIAIGTVVGVRVILGRRPFSVLWTVVSVLPTAAGAVWILGYR